MREDLLRFEQHDEGLCGLYTIVNALSILFPAEMSRTAGAVLVTRLAERLPGDIRTAIAEGTDRAQLEVLLAAAEEWTGEQGWPAWSWQGRHPPSEGKAQAFWDEIRVGQARGRRSTTLIVGFGDDDTPNTRYEPHWTCVEAIGPMVLTLRDSTEYRRVRRAETAIRPEHGWEIEDCFVLARRG